MPSVFVLDGARNIGAIAVPLAPTRGGYPEYGGRGRGGTSLMGSLGQAVSVGFGEISSGAKTGLVALGALAIVGLVAYSGANTARRRGRSLFGSRRRRRRR